MYRKLALAGLLAATSTQAYALGLGPIKLHSGLNQPLDADVELLTETPHDLNQLQVSLAPSAAFQQAGVRRTLLLTHLKFKVVKRPGGRAYIHISSPMPIREPFLDFVLEVDWSGGQLMREYTMLINPPTFMAHATPPASSSAPANAGQAAPQPAAPSSAASGTSPTMAQAAAAAGEQARAGQYGPTARTDTLWGIAAHVRPDHQVTMEQTMVALQRANPQAFYDGNINRLKAGYILRVPNRAAMTSLAPLAAQQAVAQQNAIWREARKGGGVERQASVRTAATAAQGGRLKLVAPRQPSTPVPGGAIAGGGAQAGVAGGSVASLRKELNAAREAAAAQRSEKVQLQAQVKQLQAQIQSMHHLLDVRNGNMAQVQGQSAAANATAGATGGAAAGVASQPAKSPVGPQSGAAASAAKPQGTAHPKTQTAAKAPKPAVAPVAKHEPAPVKAVQTPPPAPQPTIVDELLDHPMMDGLGGAAILVALLLGWVSARRRRMALTEFQESILAAEQAGRGSAAATRAVDDEGSAGDAGGDGAAAESSLLSDFAVSDMDAIQSEGEADPLAEADVYLAYGRYQQAEELVSDAIKSAPDRNDLHMKLLEIFHAAQNATAFDGEAESFLARLEGQDDPLWAQVVEMGREISPENPLYRDGSADETADTAAPAVAADAAESDESDIADSHELEMPELMADEQGPAVGDAEVGDDAESPAAETPLDNGLDFDLDFDLGDSVPEPTADAEVDSSDLEFTLGDDESGAATNAEISQPLDVNSEHDSGSATDGFEMPELSFDTMGTEEDNAATAESPTSAEHGSAESSALDGIGFDLDLSALPELGDDDESASGETEDGEGLLADVDEVGTKLDLARAYMDMGDPDGARSILEEVRQEGNGDQQEEAQSLLSQLA